VLAALDVEERPVDEAAWRSADEIILTNAVRGAMAVVAVDGAPVGEGAAGPLARSVHEVLRGALRGR
jgi:branched-subunit amino acid aminotransferase/4-amino-4-deoxychorismate lyase